MLGQVGFVNVTFENGSSVLVNRQDGSINATADPFDHEQTSPDDALIRGQVLDLLRGQNGTTNVDVSDDLDHTEFNPDFQ